MHLKLQNDQSEIKHQLLRWITFNNPNKSQNFHLYPIILSISLAKMRCSHPHVSKAQAQRAVNLNVMRNFAREWIRNNPQNYLLQKKCWSHNHRFHLCLSSFCPPPNKWDPSSHSKIKCQWKQIFLQTILFANWWINLEEIDHGLDLALLGVESVWYFDVNNNVDLFHERHDMEIFTWNFQFEPRTRFVSINFLKFESRKNAALFTATDTFPNCFSTSS